MKKKRRSMYLRMAKRTVLGTMPSNGIQKALKRAGIEGVRIHDFRHTCASRLIQNGMSLYEVANILGHTDVQTTQRYAHLECKDVGQRARDIMEGLNNATTTANNQLLTGG